MKREAMIQMIRTTMSTSIVLVAIVTLSGCGGGDQGPTTAPAVPESGAAAGDEILGEVPTMEEAASEAESITAEDADRALTDLERELEGDGG